MKKNIKTIKGNLADLWKKCNHQTVKLTDKSDKTTYEICYTCVISRRV